MGISPPHNPNRGDLRLRREGTGMTEGSKMKPEIGWDEVPFLGLFGVCVELLWKHQKLH